MSEDNKSAAPDKQDSQPIPEETQAPASQKLFTQEELDRVIAKRLRPVLQEREQLKRQVGELYEYHQTANTPQPDEDERFFESIVDRTMEKRLGPLTRDLQKMRAKDEVSGYFAQRGGAPDDIRDEVEAVYMDVVERGLHGQVDLDDVVAGVVGRRVKDEYLRREVAASRTSRETDAANRSAQVEGGSSAPPDPNSKRFDDLDLEEMERLLGDKGFSLD